jgi:hypothetical protein
MGYLPVKTSRHRAAGFCVYVAASDTCESWPVCSVRTEISLGAWR